MLRFSVLHASWHADGREYVAGDHEIAKPAAKLVRLVAHAHAAGVLVVTSGLDKKHVETQAQSERNLAKAMGKWVEPARDPGTGAVTVPGFWDGPWLEGHMINAAIDDANRASKGAEA